MHISELTPGPPGTTPGTFQSHQSAPQKHSLGQRKPLPRISAQAGQSESPGSTHSFPKYPRQHQLQEHHTFLPRCRFLGAPVPPNKPASRAGQAIQAASYYAKNFNPVAVPELKAFLCLRLQMEKCVIRPQYETYWQGAGHNFIVHTPGFREVMEHDCFIALWDLLHLVNQMDKAMDKSDKIYKVRPMLDRMLPLFRHYYSPRQQLSLDEGMIPTKNRLDIKKYICDKPVRWGIKSFLLCEAKMGYILDAEIYTGRVKDRHWPILGSASSVVRRLVENSQVTNKNHMLFMDPFYNSVALFHLLKNELGVLAAGTVIPSRKHYPKELGRRLTERGRYEFLCQGTLCAIILEGPQVHPLLEQLPRPEESVHCEQACGGLARAVDRTTACGGLHQVS